MSAVMALMLAIVLGAMFWTCKKDSDTMSDSLDFKKKTLKSLNTSLENPSSASCLFAMSG
jgi:hypothetical protein